MARNGDVVKYREQLGWRGVWPELELNLAAVFRRSVLVGGGKWVTWFLFPQSDGESKQQRLGCWEQVVRWMTGRVLAR